MLVYGQVRASVISAIACRTLASAILPEFLTFITRAQPRWCSCERMVFLRYAGATGSRRQRTSRTA